MDFNSIQSEKAKAMARYNRIKNIAKFRRVIELAVVAVLLISSFSSAGDFAGKVFSIAGKSLSQAVKSLSLAYNPLVSFALFNSIIAVLVLLSRKNHGGAGDDADDANIKMPVFSDSDFEIPSPPPPDVSPPPPEVSSPPPPPEESEKQMVVVERKEVEAVTMAIETARKQIRRFERTQSAILKRDITPRHQFRRSETERAISVVDKVESLSNEEFQRTIDEFIAKQQRSLLAQKLAEKKLV